MISLLIAMALQASQPTLLEGLNVPGAPKASVSKAKVYKGDESICRYEQATGSRITTRECHTRDQWAQMESSAKEYLDKISHPPGCGPGTTC